MLQETMARLKLVSNPRVAAILKAAADEFHMSVEQMVRKGRTTREDKARLLAMAALHEFMWLTWQNISRAVNRIDAKRQTPRIQKHPWIPAALTRIAERLRAMGIDPAREHMAPAPLRAEAPDVNTVIALVCAHFDTDYGDLMGNRRTQRAILPRVVAIHALRTFMGMSTPYIGRVLNRDHSTVVHHLKQGPKYPWLSATLRDIEAQLLGGAAQAAA